MPTFLRAGETDGEGVYIEPAPRRARGILREGRRLARQKLYNSWYFLRHERGLSAAEIADVFDQPLSTVKLGLKRAARHLEELGLIERPNHVPALTPIFGCRPHVPPRDAKGKILPTLPEGEPCPTCNGHVSHASLYCATCDRVSPENQRRLDAQKRQAAAVEKRKAENWQATEPKPRPTPKSARTHGPAPIALPMQATA